MITIITIIIIIMVILIILGLLGIQEEVGHLLGLRLSMLLPFLELKKRWVAWGGCLGLGV